MAGFWDVVFDYLTQRPVELGLFIFGVTAALACFAILAGSAAGAGEGKTWTHAKTLFRSHLPAVGLLDPGPVTGHVGIRLFVGEIPSDFASGDYPNIHFHDDEALFHYDRNPKFGKGAGAYWTLRIFPIEALYR